jgi:acyl-CoA synthetase (AMP-forming)/AMP-acid ligase II
MTASPAPEVDAAYVPALVGERLRRMAAENPGKTLYTHLTFDDATPVVLTRDDVWRRASAIAGVLADRGLSGRPVLLLYAAGPEFAPAFLGALLAGAIAVPAPAPQFAAQFDRLARIAADCSPGAILTTGDLRAKIFAKLDAASALRAEAWLETDTAAEAEGFAGAQPAPGDVALLQYTSGSTSEPKGVALTHANLAHNLDMLAAAFQPDGPARIVSWLPHFHDMGLMAGILGPMGCGGESILMAPQAFLLRPLRWLQAISDYRAQISGAPNFAYELCAKAVARADAAPMDLSGWRSAFAGAEPIRMATLEAFAERFRAEGFDRSALTPCYGMAEATVLVACKPAGTPPTTHRLAREAAQRGRATPSLEEGALTLTGCGHPAPGTQLRIVDPIRRQGLDRGEIGEIWIAGPQVARGYWNRQGDDNPFGAQLSAPDDGPWLRTGDLGFLAEDGELVFVDRLKDLIIINGQNYACHDIELTAAGSHALLSAANCVAVGVEVGDKTHMAIVAELAPAELESAEQVVSSIRSSVFTAHSLPVRTIAFVRPRKLSRTTSGKLQRRLTAHRLATGDLQPLAQFGETDLADPLVLFGKSDT